MATAPEEPSLWTVHALDIHGGAPEAFLHARDADLLGLHPLDRVHIFASSPGRSATAIVSIAGGFAQPGHVGASAELWTTLRLEPGQRVRLEPAPRPKSVHAIRRKLDGARLDAADIQLIIQDIGRASLSPVEITAWACAVQVHGMDPDETAACIQAMVEGGDRIHFRKGPVLDVHSIGGVPGNKYAPITVSIAAANGVIIPKTSSRAVSSACGTADFMEVLTPVALSAGRVRDITERIGATLCWGGAVNLAPADDAIIRVEYPLLLDPPSQIIASVLAKKLAVGTAKVLIDLPAGRGAKVSNDDATALARQFTDVGQRVGLEVQCVITDGSQPIGRAIGPTLEAREALQVLEGATQPVALVDKACMLAGRLLEMANKTPPGTGTALARTTLANGQALNKFREIITAQGGNGAITANELQAGPYTVEYLSPATGTILRIDNKDLSQVARIAGSPHDHGAGLLLTAQVNDHVTEGEPLMTIHSGNARHLADALVTATQEKPFTIG
ncbi:MAG: AMP phosphorylase [bacterium]